MLMAKASCARTNRGLLMSFSLRWCSNSRRLATSATNLAWSMPYSLATNRRLVATEDAMDRNAEFGIGHDTVEEHSTHPSSTDSAPQMRLRSMLLPEPFT